LPAGLAACLVVFVGLAALFAYHRPPWQVATVVDIFLLAALLSRVRRVGPVSVLSLLIARLTAGVVFSALLSRWIWSGASDYPSIADVVRASTGFSVGETLLSVLLLALIDRPLRRALPATVPGLRRHVVRLIPITGLVALAVWGGDALASGPPTFVLVSASSDLTGPGITGPGVEQLVITAPPCPLGAASRSLKIISDQVSATVLLGPVREPRGCDIEVVRSTNDGRSFSLPAEVTPPPNGNTWAVNGGPAYDPVRHAILLPYAYSSADPTCGYAATGPCFDTIGLATSTDDGQSWSLEPVTAMPSGAGTTSVLGVFVDATGHRYLVYDSTLNNRYHVYLTSSDTPGHWSTPRLVDSSQDNAIVPWATATGNGHIDVGYYRTSSLDGGNTTRHWDFVVADSRDAGQTWRTSTIATNAFTGTAASHQPSLWDLVALTYDQTGHLLVAFTDDQGRAGGPTVIEIARSRAPVKNE
jgi:hypothetical protein